MSRAQVAKNWQKLVKQTPVGLKTDYGIKHFNACEVIISAARIKRMRIEVGTQPGQFEHGPLSLSSRGDNPATAISKLAAMKSKARSEAGPEGASPPNTAPTRKGANGSLGTYKSTGAHVRVKGAGLAVAGGLGWAADVRKHGTSSGERRASAADGETHPLLYGNPPQDPSRGMEPLDGAPRVLSSEGDALVTQELADAGFLGMPRASSVASSPPARASSGGQ